MIGVSFSSKEATEFGEGGASMVLTDLEDFMVVEESLVWRTARGGLGGLLVVRSMVAPKLAESVSGSVELAVLSEGGEEEFGCSLPCWGVSSAG